MSLLVDFELPTLVSGDPEVCDRRDGVDVVVVVALRASLLRLGDLLWETDELCPFLASDRESDKVVPGDAFFFGDLVAPWTSSRRPVTLLVDSRLPALAGGDPGVSAGREDPRDGVDVVVVVALQASLLEPRDLLSETSELCPLPGANWDEDRVTPGDPFLSFGDLVAPLPASHGLLHSGDSGGAPFLTLSTLSVVPGDPVGTSCGSRAAISVPRRR